MSGLATTPPSDPAIPPFNQTLGHPSPLWMLFMSEFWERFAFYGIRWALVLYIVAQFHGGDAAGQQPAGLIYGSYLALVYAGAIFGGLVADKYLGYQRSILVGAVIMAIGLFMISVPNEAIFKLGLATIVVGNGLFKPIISTLVGKIYAVGDERRDSGFTIFYMGINVGAALSSLIVAYIGENYGWGYGFALAGAMGRVGACVTRREPAMRRGYGPCARPCYAGRRVSLRRRTSSGGSAATRTPPSGAGTRRTRTRSFPARWVPCPS